MMTTDISVQNPTKTPTDPTHEHSIALGGNLADLMTNPKNVFDSPKDSMDNVVPHKPIRRMGFLPV